MKPYHSTRSNSNTIDASQAILNGLAYDGGLYVCPLNEKVNLKEMLSYSYQKKAETIFKLFLNDFNEEEIQKCIQNAYTGTFDVEMITPLVPVGDDAVLELFHGPTSAFKDVALQILPHFMQTAKKKQNIEQDIVILTATSGDTGKAAMEGFADVEGCKIFVYYPANGVSEVQKRQMQTQKGKNVGVVGVEGNFDDCQRTVKEIFMSEKSSNEVMYSSANSINIGRLIPQIVYYFEAYGQMLEKGMIQIDEPVNFSVPTGNFGNILAGYIAKQLGLPIAKLICASNENHVLTEFIQTGVYDANREFKKTNSPSMDILISSNLERLLYYMCQDCEQVADYMNQLSRNKTYEVSEAMKSSIQEIFYSGMCNEQETCEMIKACYEKYDYLMDTHTAVAYKVTQDFKNQKMNSYKTIVLSTASPYKFSEAVLESLCNHSSENEFERMKQLHEITGVKIPEKLAELSSLQPIHTNIVKIDEMKEYVKRKLGE